MLFIVPRDFGERRRSCQRLLFESWAYVVEDSIPIRISDNQIRDLLDDRCDRFGNRRRASERKPQCKLQKAWVGKRGRGGDLTECRRSKVGVRFREVWSVGQVKRFCAELQPRGLPDG